MGSICYSHCSFFTFGVSSFLSVKFSVMCTPSVFPWPRRRPCLLHCALPCPTQKSFTNRDLFFKAAGSGTGGCGSPILRASGQIWHFTRSEYSLIGAGCCGFLGLCGFWGRHCSPFLVVGFLADPWATPLGIICFSSSIKGGDAQEQGCCPRLSKQLPSCCGRR